MFIHIVLNSSMAGRKSEADMSEILAPGSVASSEGDAAVAADDAAGVAVVGYIWIA